MKDIQCNGQKKKDKRTNNDLQYSSTQKTKDRVTRAPVKFGWWIRLLRNGNQFLFHS